MTADRGDEVWAVDAEWGYRDGRLGRESAWVPVVFLASVYAVVRGLRAMADPRFNIVAALAVLAIIAFFSFPLFWLPES